MDWRRDLPFSWLFSHLRHVRAVHHARRSYQRRWPDCRFLGENRISSTTRIGRGCILNQTELRGEVSIGRHTLLNSGVSISGLAEAPVSIGNFCSIGPGVIITSGNHPLESVSTFKSTHSELASVFSFSENCHEPIDIGSDVWLGSNVIVLPGVSIGNGAVIGAGGVVTKDVPPYAIAVGCPARTFRFRFSEGQIELLLASQWWEWPEERLTARADLFSVNFSQLPMFDARSMLS
jgi:acetyltransferase-like isoleucine patch superfamily enzyme